MVLWHGFSKFHQGQGKKQYYLCKIVKASFTHYDMKHNYIFKVFANCAIPYRRRTLPEMLPCFTCRWYTINAC